MWTRHIPPVHFDGRARSAASLVILVALALLLTGCAAAASPMPAFVVMLTQPAPMLPGRCTGVALDSTHVLTANHCADLPRIVTQAGQEAFAAGVRRWVNDDTAVVTVAPPLRLTAYARLAAPTAGFAYVWGVCPYYFSHGLRVAILMASDAREEMDGTLRHYDVWGTEYGAAVCGGDSGGILEQGGRVVGLISAVDSDFYWVAYGVRVYAVNGARVAQMVGGE